VVEASGEPPAARIAVTVFRWCWDFSYQDAPVRVTGTSQSPSTGPSWSSRPGSPSTSRSRQNGWVPGYPVDAATG
jgi:hypothetical protein